MKSTQQRPVNLILIGFMGTGKSTIGKLSARSLGFKFVDTDDVIEREAGMPISAIFEERGEAGFREMEAKALEQCAGKEHQVIATGGGIVTRAANHEILKRTGFVIWLRAKPEAILDRVSRNSNRPLLQTADPLATIRELLEARENLYEKCADIDISTSDLTIDEIVHGVTESARIGFTD